MLAQIQNVESGWLVNMIFFLVAVIGIGAAVVQAMSSRRVQKRDVTLIEEFVTRKEMGAFEDKVEGRFENLRCEMREDKTEILKAGEDRATKLHERINVVLGAVSRVEGELHARRPD